MTLPEANTIESVLGYVLKERIGAGGYGEVWRAAAPGGIFKALKIIYGFHDENRAQRELKSLDRIKEVRHPFLLSLERIEVVDGRLVVITELAEKSLKDRFGECRARGLPGIPREELIRYLSDAADVLDFISNLHSLQHLDVKPENLLLVGGHIKVGDFGLVKDVHDATQSVMAGLTPTYAASRTVRRQTVEIERSVQSGHRLPRDVDGHPTFLGNDTGAVGGTAPAGTSPTQRTASRRSAGRAAGTLQVTFAPLSRLSIPDGRPGGPHGAIRTTAAAGAREVAARAGR